MITARAIPDSKVIKSEILSNAYPECVGTNPNAAKSMDTPICILDVMPPSTKTDPLYPQLLLFLLYYNGAAELAHENGKTVHRDC